MYRLLFKFGVFNAIQSQCYDTVSRFGLATPNDAHHSTSGHEDEREYGTSGTHFSCQGLAR